MTAPPENSRPWVSVIVPKRGLFSIPWRSIWAYRDLIWLMAVRDIVASYKQTVLGPFWFVIQPLLTTVTFSFIFGRMAGFTTDVPHFVFYMSGLAVWNYFSDCVNKTALTFTRNSQLFGKVYFPRLALPLANTLTSLLAFGVQIALVLIAIAYYKVSDQLHLANDPPTEPPVLAPTPEHKKVELNPLVGVATAAEPPNVFARTIHSIFMGRTYIEVTAAADEEIVDVKQVKRAFLFIYTRLQTSKGNIYLVHAPAEPIHNYFLHKHGPSYKKGEPIVRGYVYPLWAPSHLELNWRFLTLPFLLLQAAMLALGVGCVISALTTRYKDLAMGVGFGVQLWMYASCIIFPIKLIAPSQRWIFYSNPMVPIIEGFRFALYHEGLVTKSELTTSFLTSATIFFVGVIMFNRVEQTVMDTV